MTDDDSYQQARSYFFKLYRDHLAAAFQWRGKNRRQVLWCLELAADCRKRLVHGANIRKGIVK